MHCNACTLLIESELAEVPNVVLVSAKLDDRSVTVTGDFGEMTEADIAEMLTAPVRTNGYTISAEKEVKKTAWGDFKSAVPIAALFAVLFILLQKTGLVNLIGGDGVTYGTAFVIGIVASLSTCMAVVGGLVLSMSAMFAKEGDSIRPQAMFHIGRLVSFFVLGGVIGALGSAFTLSATATFVLSFAIGVVMFILGINLLDIYDGAHRFQIGVPKFIARRAHAVRETNHVLTPVLVGIATFFLPCGFTQSMQLYTLTTGSFMNGGLTMLAFALGTLPVLALVSFSSVSVKDSPHAGKFFKSAGLIVILFALLNIVNSLVVIGLIPPVFNF